MRLFNQKKPTELTRNTANFIIGFPEAEAEVGNHTINLAAVYDDYLGVESELARGKFIVSGRKGSGKTAISERIGQLARKDTNSIATFVKGIDKAFQDSITGEHPTAKSLFEWMILSKLAESIASDEAIIERISNGDNIAKFVNANKNRINLDGTTMVEYKETSSLSLNLTHLKRLSGAYRASRSITKHQAPFHKVIPQLKDLIVEVLIAAKSIKDNDYIIVFDDLDIGVSARDKGSLDAVADLVRLARDYNQDVFARNEINCRIIILLRRDISNVIRTSYADTAKIFSSYGIDINWFEEVGINRANQTKLKKFIDARIRLNLISNGLPCDTNNPWSSLIDSQVGSGEGGSSNYVVKRTHALPRDLILFFKPLPELKLPVPLTQKCVDKLFIMYSQEKYEELQNELTFWYSPSIVNLILDTVVNVVNRRGKSFIDYSELERMFSERLDSSSADAEDVIKTLFDYSVIGSNDSKTNTTYFKHRERRGESLRVNKEWRVVVHRSVEMAITEQPV